MELSLGSNLIEDEVMTQYIYARTSTTDQNVKQQATLLQEKYPEAILREEQASATSMDRPVLEKLLRQLVNDDTIIVYDMSRLNRNTVDFLQLIEQFDKEGISLVVHNMGGSAVDTSSPVGKMVLTVLMAAEQMSVQLMKEKQAIGIARGKAEGKYQGRKQSKKTITACKKAIDFITNSGLTKEDAAKASGIGSATLYRYIKQHGLVSA